MEEIIGADVIRVEIVEDARKKAARLLEEAEAESARTLAAVKAKAAEVVEEIMRSSEARSTRFRMETLARFPLERTRMRAVFVEERLREALSSYLASLSEERVAALAAEMLSKGSSFFSGKAVSLARKGLSEAAASEAAAKVLAGAASVEPFVDSYLPAPGLVARALDGSVTLRATMDLVEERLLDKYRGELARALCAGALEL